MGRRLVALRTLPRPGRLALDIGQLARLFEWFPAGKEREQTLVGVDIDGLNRAGRRIEINEHHSRIVLTPSQARAADLPMVSLGTASCRPADQK